VPSITQELTKKKLVHPPAFLPENVMYETIMGSYAFGVSTDHSDRDIYGFCIPPKEDVFPHLAGEIQGFGKQRKRFDQFQKHHVMDGNAAGGKGLIYDLSIYSIVRYFELCMENNPNVIDSLFTPHDCVLHVTAVGNLVRDHRTKFLHKGCWPKFKGYAYSQLHKMRSKQPIGKRKELREEFGFDVKFAYHTVRLLLECEQILMHRDIDLRRDREHLKAIRRGEVSQEEIFLLASEKERDLENLYHESKIPDGPDESQLKELLLNCLEQHYGNLDACIARVDANSIALKEITEIVDRVRNRI
jgi:predicted nucleotidyltransferase